MTTIQSIEKALDEQKEEYRGSLLRMEQNEGIDFEALVHAYNLAIDEIKPVVRTKIEEILDEAIGERRDSTKIADSIGGHSTESMDLGYNTKREELLSLKQKINNQQ